MTIYYILLSTVLGTYIFLGLYMNYMTIRDDIREQRERKAKMKEGNVNGHR